MVDPADLTADRSPARDSDLAPQHFGGVAGRSASGARGHGTANDVEQRASHETGQPRPSDDADTPQTDAESALRSELAVAQRRAAFLSEASSILVATSVNFETTLQALARLAVSRLAEWCSIHSIDSSGRLERVVATHRDPRLEDALTRLVDQSLNDRWRQTVRSVASTGRSHIVTELRVDSWFDADVGGTIGPELLEKLADGSAMITPLTGRGDVLGAITFVSSDARHSFDDQDLTLAEELGRRAAIALDNARLYRQAHEAKRVKADFLAVMSHELRTPLNAIMGYTDLLDAGVSGDVNDRQHHQLDRIRASARHLLQLIEEILSFARMEAGAEEVQVESVSLDELLNNIAAEIRPLAEAKGLTFTIDTRSEGVTIRTDPAKARQVLMNLLSNAVKFTEEGSVTVRLTTDEAHVHLDVIDTGIGIPQEQIDRIYDPFWQLERPNTRRVGGTGLGLSVSRRYTRLLGGEMSVQSNPGRGTTVMVALPLNPASHDSD